MKKKSNLKSKKESWWTSVPGLLTSLTATIVTITGLIATANSFTPVVLTWFPTATPPSRGCSEYVHGIQTGVIQRDSKDSVLFEISSPQSLEDARLLILESDAKEIGKIKFLFLETENSFELASVVDPLCRQVPQSNSAGTSIFVKNGETTSLKFEGKEYILRLTYKDGRIVGDFQ